MTPAGPAHLSGLAHWAFHRYVRRLASRHFRAIHWSAPPTALAAAPRVLFVANHTNWWDGFLAYLVTARLGRQFHVLMEAQNLERYGLFRHIGAMPLHRGHPRDSYRDLESAVLALRRPGTALWIFPQGSRRPPPEPVERLEHGAAHILGAMPPDALAQPVALRYTWLGEQLPEAFVWFGDPVSVGPPGTGRASRRRLTERIAVGLAGAVAALDARLAEERIGEFRPLLEGRMSVNSRLDRARHRLGLLRGAFEPRNG